MGSAVSSVRGAIERLASIQRGSCSPGEHEAAEWLAARLREVGAEARVERERVHGTYWWPLGITSALGLAGAVLARRGRARSGAALAALGTLAVFDDLDVGPRVLRRLLPKQVAANVVAETGDRDAALTLVFVSHHDAAHSGFFFNPAVASALARFTGLGSGGEGRFAPPPMAPIAAAPAFVALGAISGLRWLRLLGSLMCTGIIGSFIDMAVRSAVPGANDNASGVATLLGVARRLSERPPEGVTVLCVSTGAEESLMEGMRAFAARHFAQLSPERTAVVCVDTVGSAHLVLAGAEGLLRVREYDAELSGLIAACADRLGVPLRRGGRMRFATDGYVALRHGLPAALLTSVNDAGTPSDYHWHTDTPDRLDYGQIEAAVALCEELVRALSSESRAAPPAPQPSAAHP
ncbi:MAG TPA: M28 family peptidase [Thermoleophilaceae bacterium]